MIRIAHRGNYQGKNESRENRLDYLQEALDAGFAIEVDVRFVKGQFWLGHDVKQEKVSLDFLENPLVWVHSKNMDALLELWHNPAVNTFWHDQDPFTYTSKGIKWANVRMDETIDGIAVMPDGHSLICHKIRSGIYTPYGVCSDNFSLFESLRIV